MAKSARSSAVKKNNQRLKQKVFGPVETARNERLNAKLLELAAQPKPEKNDMDVEREEVEDDPSASKDADADVDMEADKTTIPASRSRGEQKRHKAAKSARIEKKRHRKTRNKVVFPTHPKKPKPGSKR